MLSNDQPGLAAVISALDRPRWDDDFYEVAVEVLRVIGPEYRAVVAWDDQWCEALNATPHQAIAAGRIGEVLEYLKTQPTAGNA